MIGALAPLSTPTAVTHCPWINGLRIADCGQHRIGWAGDRESSIEHRASGRAAALPPYSSFLPRHSSFLILPSSSLQIR